MQAFKVVLLLACLAGVASAASWTTGKICEECKHSAEQIKKNLPHIEDVIIGQCKKIDAKEEQDKCIASAKAYIEKVSKETPEQICQDLNLCPRVVPFALGRPGQPMCALCEPCKQMAQMIKDGLEQAQDQLKGLCKNCGAPENVKKCEQAIDKFIHNVEKKSPEELCTEIGLCKNH